MYETKMDYCPWRTCRKLYVLLSDFSPPMSAQTMFLITVCLETRVQSLSGQVTKGSWNTSPQTHLGQVPVRPCRTASTTTDTSV